MLAFAHRHHQIARQVEAATRRLVTIRGARALRLVQGRGEGWALERKRLGVRQPVDSAWELRRLRRPGERGAEGEPTWAG
eukprot:scaffold4663_cov104-Isochrysis_galbana.AAC.3